MKKVILQTKDGVNIAADYYVSGGESGAVLLHMMPVDRKSWLGFAEKLKEAGFSVLAVDLRGHGESDRGPDGYKKFSDEEHRSSRFDVEAAADFLTAKSVGKLHLVGASIGANLALEFLVSHPEARSAVLLSPGLDYRGLKTEPLITEVSPRQAVFLAAASDDHYSSDTVKILGSKIYLDGRRQMRLFDKGGHGTELFLSHPELAGEIVGWLRNL